MADRVVFSAFHITPNIRAREDLLITEVDAATLRFACFARINGDDPDEDVIQQESCDLRRSIVATCRDALTEWLGDGGSRTVAAPLSVELRPDRWFRIFDSGGRLWMETSDEQEARDEATRQLLPLDRLWTGTVHEWRREQADPKGPVAK